MSKMIESLVKGFYNAVIGENKSVLSGIHEENKSIAIYERNTVHLQKDIDALSQTNVEFRFGGTIEDVIAFFSKNLETYPKLQQDVIDLIRMFGDISRADSFRVLLATINSNMCRKFHTDMNDLRLLCTYSGQGTVWLPEEAVVRESLSARGENDSIVADAELIQQASSGDVLILKGAVYPKKGTKAIVHRSPTIEEFAEERILLRIDTNDLFNF